MLKKNQMIITRKKNKFTNKPYTILLMRNKRETRIYGKELYKAWVKKLTNNEINSLRKYKGILIFSNYLKINSALRKDLHDLYHNDVTNISNAINKSIINKDIVCIRNSSVKFLEANGFTIDSVESGITLIEKGFMSTYLYKPKCRFTAKLVLIIRVPKGARGAYINNILPWWSGNQSEHEMIFNKNSKLKVLEKRIQKKRVYLEVELIPE